MPRSPISRYWVRRRRYFAKRKLYYRWPRNDVGHQTLMPASRSNDAVSNSGKPITPE